MRTAPLFAAILLTCSSFVGAANAQSNALAIVNGEAITESDIRLAELEWRDRIQNLTGDVRRRALLNFLLEAQIVAKAAIDEKVLPQKERAELERFSARLALQSYYINKKIIAQTSEDEIRKLYSAQVKALPAEEEVKASHILVDSLEQANELENKVRGGADFADLARRYSQDPTTNLLGGSLGYFVKTQMIPEIEQAAFALPRGQVSKPIETSFGWHLVRVDDRRPLPVPTFEDLKMQLTAAIVHQKTQAMIAALRGKAIIEIKDPSLSGEAAGVQTAAATPTSKNDLVARILSKKELGFVIYQDFDIIGDDLNILKKVEQQACAKTCQSNQSCMAYSYDRWNKWCFLKSNARTLTLDPSSVSGARESLAQPPASDAAVRIERRASKRFVGSPKSAPADSLEACEALCQKQFSCLGYSFSKNERVCGLFDNIASITPNSGAVSGIKTQSPP